MTPNSDVDFEDVVCRARSGRLLIGVDGAFARRFYTGVPVSVVKEHTNTSPYTEKGLVLAAWVGGPVTLFLTAILTPFVIGWWSALVIPLGVLLWIVSYQLSSVGGVQVAAVSTALAVAAVLSAMNLWPDRDIWTLVFLYVLALWCGCFVYAGSTWFLRAFVLRNRKAFEWLGGALTLREVDSNTSASRLLRPRPSLRRISKQLGRRMNLRQPLGKQLAESERYAKAEEALLDYCESQPAIRAVMSEFELSRHDLEELYHWLLSQGAGQWRSGHWVAASTLAYPELLRYVLIRKAGNDLETIANLITRFDQGSADTTSTS